MEDRIVVDFNALDRIARKLNTAGSDLDAAMSILSSAQLTNAGGAYLRLNGAGLSLKSVGGSVSAGNVTQAVQNYRSALKRISEHSRSLSQAVSNTAAAFRQTEAGLTGTVGAASAGEAAPTSVGESVSKSSFPWSTLWDFVGGAGFVGSCIAIVGELITGGHSDMPKSTMEALKYLVKSSGVAIGGTASNSSFGWERFIGNSNGKYKKYADKFLHHIQDQVGNVVAVSGIIVWNKFKNADRICEMLAGKGVVEMTALEGVAVGTSISSGLTSAVATLSDSINTVSDLMSEKNADEHSAVQEALDQYERRVKEKEDYLEECDRLGETANASVLQQYDQEIKELYKNYLNTKEKVETVGEQPEVINELWKAASNLDETSKAVTETAIEDATPVGKVLIKKTISVEENLVTDLLHITPIVQAGHAELDVYQSGGELGQQVYEGAKAVTVEWLPEKIFPQKELYAAVTSVALEPSIDWGAGQIGIDYGLDTSTASVKAGIEAGIEAGMKDFIEDSDELSFAW